MGRPHPSAPRVALMTTHEFASVGWVDAYEDVVREEMAGVDTGGLPLRIAREFTDAPAALCDPGQTSVGWCLEVRDGVVEVHRGPSRDGDAVTISDYDAIAPAARLVIGDDGNARARAGRDRRLRDGRREALAVRRGHVARRGAPAAVAHP